MSETVQCTRCGRQAPALESPPPLPNKLAAEIRENVCAQCWAEWEGMEVMVINELQLNFMDPQSQDVLNTHMREFFGLDAGTPKDPHLPTKESNEAEESSG